MLLDAKPVARQTPVGAGSAAYLLVVPDVLGGEDEPLAYGAFYEQLLYVKLLPPGDVEVVWLVFLVRREEVFYAPD